QDPGDRAAAFLCTGLVAGCTQRTGADPGVGGSGALAGVERAAARRRTAGLPGFAGRAVLLRRRGRGAPVHAPAVAVGCPAGRVDRVVLAGARGVRNPAALLPLVVPAAAVFRQVHQILTRSCGARYMACPSCAPQASYHASMLRTVIAR